MRPSSDDDYGIYDEDMQRAAAAQSDFLAIMANRHRLHILFLLSEAEYSVGDLMRELKETPVGVSRHLTILRDNNIVRSRRCGKNVRYSLTCPHTVRMVKAIAEICCLRDAEDAAG